MSIFNLSVIEGQSTEVSAENMRTVCFTMPKGKDITSAKKLAHATGQGADAAMLLVHGKFAKQIKESLGAERVDLHARAVAGGQYLTPIITLATLAGVPTAFSKDEVTGAVRRRDWSEFRAQLTTGKTKATAKALALWDEIQAAADKIREERAATQQQKMAA
jgi:hypothetical protein